jgi:hypothetical protein
MYRNAAVCAAAVAVIPRVSDDWRQLLHLLNLLRMLLLLAE